MSSVIPLLSANVITRPHRWPSDGWWPGREERQDLADRRPGRRDAGGHADPVVGRAADREAGLGPRRGAYRGYPVQVPDGVLRQCAPPPGDPAGGRDAPYP